MVVLRAFPDEVVHHPMGSVDPLRDLRHIEEEFILQDQMVVERRLERIRRDQAKRPTPEMASEANLLERCLGALEAQRPLRTVDFEPDDERGLRGFTFLSIKPILVVLNVGENAVADDPFDGEGWDDWRACSGMAFTHVCATLEKELAELDADDAAAFMEDLGITESALDRVVNESYRLLGLISFFTVGEDECRAWSVRAGTSAVDAGGVIHSDIKRGFIRAEVVPNDELRIAGSLAACRQRGSLRLEGKSYPVQDGEVVHFRFNV
jgi:GTP-binding protein YchF